jgi:pentatricopeptide repeat protein
VETIEADIQHILMNNYISNYVGVAYVNDLLIELGPEKFSKKENKWIKNLDGKLESLYELNTYSNVLFYGGKMDEAIAAARLNSKLFPGEIKVYTSLANKLLKTGNTEEAIQLYEKAVSMDPEDEYNLAKLNELKSVN